MRQRGSCLTAQNVDRALGRFHPLWGIPLLRLVTGARLAVPAVGGIRWREEGLCATNLDWYGGCSRRDQLRHLFRLPHPQPDFSNQPSLRTLHQSCYCPKITFCARQDCAQVTFAPTKGESWKRERASAETIKRKRMQEQKEKKKTCPKSLRSSLVRSEGRCY